MNTEEEFKKLSFNKEYLYEFYKNNKNVKFVKNNIIKFEVFHLQEWESNNIIERLGGMYLCRSMLTFSLCAYGEELFNDQSLRLIDFLPLIYESIHNDFYHNQITKVIPIIGMSLQVISDLICGVEWLLYSDLFILKRRQKTCDYFIEIFRLVNLMKKRIYYFMTNNQLKSSFFNMKKYYTIIETNETTKEIISYKSDSDLDDDIKTTTNKKKLHPKKIKLSVNGDSDDDELVDNSLNVEINNIFVAEMDTKFSLMSLELTNTIKLLRSNLIQCTNNNNSGEEEEEEEEENGNSLLIKITNFRKNLIDICENTYEHKLLISQRNTWKQNLQVHLSYKRSYLFNFDTKNPTPVQLLSYNNEKLFKYGHCKSLKQCKQPNNIRLTTDAWFNFHSSQNDSVVSLLIEDKQIYRNQLLNTWIVDNREANSLIHAFYLYCKKQKVYKNIDLNIYYDWFHLKEEDEEKNRRH